MCRRLTDPYLSRFDTFFSSLYSIKVLLGKRALRDECQYRADTKNPIGGNSFFFASMLVSARLHASKWVGKSDRH